MSQLDHAIALIHAADWTNAAAELTEVIRQNPTNASAYEYRAAALFMSHQLTNAIADFNQTLRLEPNNLRVLLNRGNAHRMIGKLDEAIQDFTTVISQEPTNGTALQSRGICFVKKQQPEKAIPDLNRAIDLNTNASHSLFWRGRAFERMGKFEDSVQDYHDAVKADSKNDSAWNNLAWLLATCPKDSIRNGREAVAAALQACELSHWNNGEYIDTLAAAYAEAGDFTKAIEYEKRAIGMKDVTERSRDDMKLSLSLYEKQQPKRDDQKSVW